MADIKMKYNTVLSIAGSDSGGCAGIQADIKSISACGSFAATAITATTAQNTQGVGDIYPIPVEHVEAQIEAVLSDIEVNAVKIGMLHSFEMINAVKDKLLLYKAKNIVLDPVMVATSGDRLINEDALSCLKELLPLATLITPNIPEAELLLGEKIDVNNIEEAALDLGDMFLTSILLKGGHLEGNELVDVLYDFDSNSVFTIKNNKIHTKNTHGTGCSLSSSIAAFLSQGYDLKTSVRQANSYLQQAILSGKDKVLGKGNGPVDHNFN